MALVRIYNPASGNFAHAPERAVDKGALPKWRRARPDDKPRAKKAPGVQQSAAAPKKSTGAQTSGDEKENS